MKKIKILMTCLVVLSLLSCKKFLDKVPTNYADSNEAVKTTGDAQVMINGIMRNMTNSEYYGRNFMLYGDVKGGDMTIFSQGRGSDGLYVFNHTPISGSNSTFWSRIYYCITLTNNLLENIRKLEATGATGFNSYKGQALTLRALMYFDLVRLYGKAYTDDKNSLGVPNVITPLDANAQPLRATVADNYIQILADLKAAAPLLSKAKTGGYINYYGNMALQARVYLNMNDMPNALIAAEDVIANGQYTPYTNANWLDSWKSQFGTESIFELSILPLEGDLGSASLGYYLRRRGDGGGTVLGWFMGSDYFLTRLNQDATDVRWGLMAADESAATHKGALYKYSGNIALAGDGKATNSAVNIKVIRVSEVYLIAAEAAFLTDKLKSATYLNIVRRRSPLLPAATAANITMDMILDERSKELFGEGQRFFDMIRLNKTITFNDEFGALVIPVSNRPKTIDRTFYKTRLPIPQEEINANPGLKPQQNPGYN